MFNKKESEVNILNDLILDDEEREIRAKYGRYIVYEYEHDFIEIIGNLISENLKNSNKDIDVKIDNIEVFADLFRSVTNLLDGVNDIKIIEKLIKSKPTRKFKNIMSDVLDMVREATEDLMKDISYETKLVNKMTPEQRRLYDIEKKRKLDSLINKTDEEKEIEELEKELAEKKAKLQK